MAVIDYGRHKFQFQKHKNSSFKTLINKAMGIGKETIPLKDEVYRCGTVFAPAKQSQGNDIK